jgi:GNAT superfamily N-acetyltransferase
VAVSLELTAPQPLSPDHKTEQFDCGEPSLDDWLRRRALANHQSGASRTFVVIDAERRVVGYYALAAGAVSHREATGSVRRNMPEPIPVMVLARLAVDRRAQGMKLGASLLRDALLRTQAVAESAGIRALVVHALHEPARDFYVHHGFQPSPMHPLILMLRLPVRPHG